MKHEIISGDCLDVMRTMQENSIDFIVTDPPYGLHFMGKDWDKFKQSNYDLSPVKQVMSIDGYSRIARSFNCANTESGTYDPKRDDEFQEFMRQFGLETLRILKPGGHIAMFGAPRRHHRQMSGLEDAGFEIRDCIAWIFGQGFPKSHNFGRQLSEDWKGYGTALKPAYEPIILAMKPLDGTFVQNAEKWGVAGINIDESRISISDGDNIHKKNPHTIHVDKDSYSGGFSISQYKVPQGRWPANIIFDEEAAKELDQMTGILKSGSGIKNPIGGATTGFHASNWKDSGYRQGDSGGASRFFYCAKASSSERGKDNTHPTVKPIALMKYILKLLAPPGNPTCLDPFAGSGSTLVAAKELGINCIGIEKQEEYVEIARKRVENVPIPQTQYEMFA